MRFPRYCRWCNRCGDPVHRSGSSCSWGSSPRIRWPCTKGPALAKAMACRSGPYHLPILCAVLRCSWSFPLCWVVGCCRVAPLSPAPYDGRGAGLVCGGVTSSLSSLPLSLRSPLDAFLRYVVGGPLPLRVPRPVAPRPALRLSCPASRLLLSRSG